MPKIFNTPPVLEIPKMWEAIGTRDMYGTKIAQTIDEEWKAVAEAQRDADLKWFVKLLKENVETYWYLDTEHKFVGRVSFSLTGSQWDALQKAGEK